MITLFIILGILGVIFIAATGVCAVLLDPIIAILIIAGIFKLVKMLFTKRK